MRPARGGVLSAPTTLYRFFDERDQLLYVGIAGNPGRRFDQHAKGPDGKPWWPRVVRSTMEHFDTREAALAAEAAAIITEGPLHNVVHNRNPGVPLPRPPGNTRLRTMDRPPSIDTARYHALMAAVDAIAGDPTAGFECQEDLASWLAACGRIVPYGDYCDTCSHDRVGRPGSADPMRYPASWRVAEAGVQAAYACPFCGSSWSCWWSLDAPWLAASRPVDNLGVTL